MCASNDLVGRGHKGPREVNLWPARPNRAIQLLQRKVGLASPEGLSMTIAQSSLDPKNSTFLTSSGDGYELQMGRHSRSLAPLFVAFAAARAAGQGSRRWLRNGQSRRGANLANNSTFTSIEAFDFSPPYIGYANALLRSPPTPLMSHSRCWCLRLSRSRNASTIRGSLARRRLFAKSHRKLPRAQHNIIGSGSCADPGTMAGASMSWRRCRAVWK